MKFGLRITNNKLISEFGGIGETIVNSLNRNRDVYLLKSIKKDIEDLNSSEKVSIKIHSTDYRYLKIGSEITTSYLYNEFDENSNPEIELGSIQTVDLIPILSRYLDLQIEKNSELIKLLDSIYTSLDKLIESKKDIIHSYTRRENYSEIRLNSGNECTKSLYILKVYRLEFHNDRICLTKNRKYQKQPPKMFELNKNGTEKLISFLERDLENWYSQKMKMSYDSDNKLVVVPDND